MKRKRSESLDLLSRKFSGFVKFPEKYFSNSTHIFDDFIKAVSLADVLSNGL